MQPLARLVVALCALSLTGCGITQQTVPSNLSANMTLPGASGYLALKGVTIKDAFSDDSASRGGGGYPGATAGSVDTIVLVESETMEPSESTEPIIVVVNARNQFAHSLTMHEIRRIWQGSSTVETWRDVRPDWPNRPIRRYALQSRATLCEQFGKIAGRDSVSSARVTQARDNESLVGMISSDPDAISFMGNSHFHRFKHILRPLAIGDSGVPVLPSSVSIGDGSYSLGLRDLSLTLAQPAVPPNRH